MRLDINLATQPLRRCRANSGCAGAARWLVLGILTLLLLSRA